LIIIDKIIVFGDPCVDYILLKLINMMYLDYRKENIMKIHQFLANL